MREKIIVEHGGCHYAITEKDGHYGSLLTAIAIANNPKLHCDTFYKMQDAQGETEDHEDVDGILREMGDYDGVVEYFAFRLANALKHKCRACEFVKHWQDAHRNQGEIMAETARQNIRLREELRKLREEVVA